MKKRRPFAALLLLFAFHSSLADQIAPVIVTASRTAQTADEALAAVTVITREEIEHRQSPSVQELLRGIAGVDVANSGGAGKATSLFLRGTEADHVLVLMDGIKVGSATTGAVAFQDIPIEQIERIEIVRGPRSSLYGSEAIGGVIQIFTRKGGGKLKPYLSLGGGSDATYDAAAGVSGGGERLWFSANASGSDTDGFNACGGKPAPGGAGCFTTEPDDDGYRNRSASLRVGYRSERGMVMDVHALRAEGETEFDGSFVNESESLQQVLGGSVLLPATQRWNITVTAGRSRDESDNFKDGLFKSRFDTQRDTLSFQNDVAIGGKHLLTLGADYQDDRIDSTTAYAVDSRDNTGFFAQYQGGFDAHDVQLSLRRDDNEQFGDRGTGAAAWGYALGGSLRLTASYGTAFKAPTFNELYFPGFGNAALRPETSRSAELGLGASAAGGRWSLNAYETRIDELIAYDASISAPGNIDEARIRGLEAVLGTRLGDWDMAANITLLDPINQSGGDNDGNVLPRRSRRSLRCDVDRDFGRYRLGATLLAAGERYDDLANTRELGGYGTVDVRAEYLFSGDWRLQAKVTNLFDKDYETAAFFNQPGRGAYLTLRYQP